MINLHAIDCVCRLVTQKFSFLLWGLLCIFSTINKRPSLNQQEFLRLVNKYLAGNATGDETARLLKYYDGLQHASNWDETKLGNRVEMEEKLWEKIVAKIGRHTSFSVRPLYKRTWFKAAAILIVGTAFFAWLHNKQGASASLAKREVQPAGIPYRETTLLLSNGVAIPLDAAANGVLATLENTVVKKENNKLLFEVNGKNISEPNDASAYNYLITPKGHQFEIVLADGSRVWLNAASSLGFPAAFSGRARRVEIKGEAYFEVAKDKAKPFNVYASAIENNEGKAALVEVLGTHFNVNAYVDETSLKTTLLEGSVKISPVNTGHATPGMASVLSPGQQAQVFSQSSSKEMQIAAVDVTEAVAWTKNQFDFNNAGLPFIMRQLARWYNVEVEYKGRVPQRNFSGTINRAATLQTVLKILEQSDVHFRVEGNRIVMKS